MDYLKDIETMLRNCKDLGLIDGEQQANLRKWGEYLVRSRGRQARGALKRGASKGGGRCCLGVAVDVFPDVARWKPGGFGYIDAVFGDTHKETETTWPGHFWKQQFGIIDQAPFYHANDRQKASFKQIGRAILAGLG